MSTLLDSLEITFTEETFEESCLKQEPKCSNVATHTIRWLHVSDTVCSRGRVYESNYCFSHTNEFKLNQHELGVGAECSMCTGVLRILEVRRIKK